MYCNNQIHSELIMMDTNTCPFCSELLIIGGTSNEPCCNDQNIGIINGYNVSSNCGSSHGPDLKHEYINYSENLYKFKKKSLYNRQYHVENVLTAICLEYGIVLTYAQRSCIYKIFVIIGQCIPLINKQRKRMISTKFIIKQLFMLLGLPYECIKTSNSKRTIDFYNEYYKQILDLRYDDIMRIIG